MWPYFTHNNITYNLRKEPILYLPSMHSTYYDTNSVKSVSEFKNVKILIVDV